METSADVTVRVTIEIPRDEYVEDFSVNRSKWEAMTEEEQGELVDTEFYPVALSNSGVNASFKVVDGKEGVTS